MSEAARPKSDTPVEKFRTDEAVSELANLGKDTIRKIERIEEAAQPVRQELHTPSR